MTAGALGAPSRRPGLWLQRAAVALAAILVVALAFALLASLLASPPPPPVRGPFGTGLREAAPSTTGLGGAILALQGQFYRGLQGAVTALKESGGALWSLLALGFGYGAFHAAGPGHGKAVIAAYLVSSERALRRGVGMSFAAALVQALVAIAVVSVVAVLLRATAATMSRVANGVELLSFATVALLGAAVTWRKAGALIGVAALARDPLANSPAAACDHAHLPPPEALERLSHWRERAGIVLAAGIRPCAGAIIVLVFALSQGLFAAGIAATFAMALGTALTTSAIAVLAVFAKRLALRLAGGRGAAAALVVAGLELLAAAFVLVLGLALLSGYWSAGTGA